LSWKLVLAILEVRTSNLEVLQKFEKNSTKNEEEPDNSFERPHKRPIGQIMNGDKGDKGRETVKSRD